MRGLYLIFGHYSIIEAAWNMARTDKSHVKYYAKSYVYPCGVMDIMASSDPIFSEKGWEVADNWSTAKKAINAALDQQSCPDAGTKREAEAEDIQRSMRRAKAKVRRIALANDFKYFVTLTLDPEKVDRYSGEAVVKKLNAWASNAVQRNGLKYILVPERHKKGGIHFHGFFNDAFPVVDSGTIRVPWAKKPKRPRSKAERADWLQRGGVVVYNLPGWSLGFTTAMELYGSYPAAVAYVCKYIGKDGEKPAGRWYYSGGDLQKPKEIYMDISPAELVADYGDKAMLIYPPGKQIAIVNGLKVLDRVQNEEDNKND